MELVQELLMTAFVTLIFAFVIVKLVSIAMSSDDYLQPDLPFKSEVKLRTGLTFDKPKTKKRVRFVDQFVENLDEFQTKKIPAENVKRVQFVDQIAENLDEFENQKYPNNIKRFQSKISEIDGGFESRVEEQNCASGLDELMVEEKTECTNVVEEEMEVASRLDNLMAEERRIQIENEKRMSDEDDDDWERIERSDVQMELYGLHKVALEGPCHETQPMAIQFTGRAKWNACQKLGNMSSETAMEKYIGVVSDRVPGRMEADITEYGKKGFAESGMPCHPDPNRSALIDTRLNSTNERIKN